MKIVRTIASFALILSTLWAGTGFTVSRHYCMGMLKSERFYFDSNQCVTNSNGSDCPRSKEVIEDSCCQHKSLSVAAVDITRLNEEALLAPLNLAALPIGKVTASVHNQNSHLANKTSYSPPVLPPANILSEIQRYLI